ncbi:hypothetical protein [Embleya sp. AB8]|uniref:hypothetical protein n=1 Tax=Embleya sp. AB8 TaxID=3156304 RepID=UPI003C72E4CC
MRIAHVRGARQDLADLLDWCVTAFQVLIPRTLNSPPPRHRLRSPGWLDAFLNDFIGADLRSEDLAPTDLDGVRWSYDTCWPPAIDIEDLRNRSQESPVGSGIYVGQPGPATVSR